MGLSGRDFFCRPSCKFLENLLNLTDQCRDSNLIKICLIHVTTIRHCNIRQFFFPVAVNTRVQSNKEHTE